MTYLYTVQSDKGIFTALSLLTPEDGFAGGIPPQAIIGTLAGNVSRIRPSDFKPNGAFIAFLHMVIKRYAPLNTELQKAAKREHEGWIYIIDCRVGDPQGAVEPEDIIGAFKIESGKIAPESYQPNTKHLLVSEWGIFCLDEWLKDKLLAETRSLLSHS